MKGNKNNKDFNYKTIKDFKTAKKDIEKEMVNKILDYLKNSIFLFI